MSINPVERVSPSQRKKLEVEEWAVFTTNEVTQNAIARRLAEKRDLENTNFEIFYNGKEIPVFIVDFDIIEFLANNRYSTPYSFTAYHRINRHYPWKKWHECVRTPKQRIIKYKKRGLTVQIPPEKSALRFKQERHK